MRLIQTLLENDSEPLSTQAIALLRLIIKRDAAGSSALDPENKASEELLKARLVNSDGGDRLFLTASKERLKAVLGVL